MAAGPHVAGLEGIRRGKAAAFAVSWVASSPRGFAVEVEDGLVLGEAVGLPDRDALREIALTARREKALPALPDSVLWLLCVDGQRGSIEAAVSTRSARTFNYALSRGTFVASTSYSVLRLMGVALDLAEENVGEHLVYRYVLPPHTLCRGVRCLGGGESATFDLETGALVATHQHSFPSPSPDRAGGGPTLDELESVLTEDMERALAESRRPVLLLSGGVDSTLTAILALRVAPQLRSASSSFSFVNRDDAESAYALSAAHQLGIDHRIHHSSEEMYLRGLVRAIEAAEAPVHHLQSVMLFLLFEELAEEEADVILCGEGADCIFGSEAHQKLYKYRNLLRFAQATGSDWLYRLALALLPNPGRRFTYFAQEFGDNLDSDRHLLWTLGAFGDPEVASRITGYETTTFHESRRRLMSRYRYLPLLQQVSVLSLLGEVGATTSIWGRLAERAGLILHFPFAAPSFVDLVLQLPWELKLREPKYPMRALLRRHGVPERLIGRPKLGFGLPSEFWALPGTLFQPVVDCASQRYDASLLRSLQTDRAGSTMVLWGLLGLDLWRRLVLEGVSAEDLADELVARRRPRGERFG